MPVWDGEINPFGITNLPFYFMSRALSSTFTSYCEHAARPASKQRTTVKGPDTSLFAYLHEGRNDENIHHL